MKKTSFAIKWCIIFIWLGTPLLFKSFGIYFIGDFIVILWLLFSYIVSIVPFPVSYYRVMHHLRVRYPDQYRKIISYQTTSHGLRAINARYDMIFTFSPENDQTYVWLKRRFKGCMIYMFVSILCSFCAFWGYVAM